jgi:catechol 2,3-dioxygenase-like lactoylglutathione lyase family enzyme
MIDHISVPVSDLALSARFYEAVLAPLGLKLLVDREATTGFGKSYPEIWLNLRPDVIPVANPGGHVCLRAPDEDAVRAFHKIALEKGGKDEGAPGPRQGAMTNYFGAFILDRDGNKIEAVTFPKARPA